MKRAYLHIGMEKTGTTSLQSFLKANEGRLNDSGFSYLCDESKPYVEGDGHFPVAGCLLPYCPDFVSPAKYRPESEVLESLKEDVESSPHDVILSCEHFSSRLRDVQALRTIRKVLLSRNVTVMCYLRRQDDMAVANYSTAVRCGRRAPFSVDEIIHPSIWRFNFLKIATLWASVFGWENLVLLHYDPNSLQGGDIRSDFLNRLGIPTERLHFGKRSNLSLEPRQVELLRAANSYLNTFGEGDRESYDLSQNARQVILEHLPSSKQSFSLLTTSDRQRILKVFSQSNADLATKANDAEFLREWGSSSETRISRGAAFGSPSAQDLAEMVAGLAKAIVLLRDRNTTAMRSILDELALERERTEELQARISTHLDELALERERTEELQARVSTHRSGSGKVASDDPVVGHSIEGSETRRRASLRFLARSLGVCRSLVNRGREQ